MSRQPGNIACHICDVSFASAAALSAHKEDRHTLGRFSCMWCGTEFRLKIDLRQHGPQCTTSPVESGTEYYRAPKPERQSVEAAFGVRHQTALPKKHRASSGGGSSVRDSGRVSGGTFSTFTLPAFSAVPAGDHSLPGSSQQMHAGGFYPQTQHLPPGPEEMQLYPPSPPQQASGCSPPGWPADQPGYVEHQLANVDASAQCQYAAAESASGEEQQRYWPYGYQHASVDAGTQCQYTAAESASDEEQQRYWAYGYPPASGA